MALAEEILLWLLVIGMAGPNLVHISINEVTFIRKQRTQAAVTVLCLPELSQAHYSYQLLRRGRTN